MSSQAAEWHAAVLLTGLQNSFAFDWDFLPASIWGFPSSFSVMFWTLDFVGFGLGNTSLVSSSRMCTCFKKNRDRLGPVCKFIFQLLYFLMLPADVPGKVAKNGPVLGLCAHGENLDTPPGSWPWRGPALAIVAVLEMNQRIEVCVCLPVSVTVPLEREGEKEKVLL